MLVVTAATDIVGAKPGLQPGVLPLEEAGVWEVHCPIRAVRLAVWTI